MLSNVLNIHHGLKNYLFHSYSQIFFDSINLFILSFCLFFCFFQFKILGGMVHENLDVEVKRIITAKFSVLLLVYQYY